MLGFYLALIDEPTDKELFKSIYRINKKLMYKTAFKAISDRELAKDAVQESLLKIARNIKKFQDHDSDRTAALITVITRNTAISLQRKELKEREISGSPNREKEINPVILDEITIRENYETVLNAIKSLEDIYSDVLMLKYVYGYDSKTISDMFDVSVRTVESRLYRGRKLLAEKLEEAYGLQESIK